jgi:AAA+ superfamily predicted ATPase
MKNIVFEFFGEELIFLLRSAMDAKDRSSYKKALRILDGALEIDPTYEPAICLRHEIRERLGFVDDRRKNGKGKGNGRDKGNGNGNGRDNGNGNGNGRDNGNGNGKANAEKPSRGNVDSDIIAEQEERNLNADRLYKEANDRYSDEDYMKAIELYERALALKPTRVEKISYNLSLAWSCVGDFEKAAGVLRELTATNPRMPEIYYIYGLVLENLDRPLEAIREHCNALERDAKLKDSLNRMDILLGKLREGWVPPDKTPSKALEKASSSPLSDTTKMITISFDENDRERTVAQVTEFPLERKTFASVVLPEDTKLQFQRMKKMIRFKDARKRAKVAKPAGVILEGPNGTGKSLAAMALAGELGWNLVVISFSAIACKWYGESERNVRRCIDVAAKYFPAVLLLDEVDSFAAAKEFRSNNVPIVNALLDMINRLNNEMAEKDVFIVATTNHVNMLDKSVKRSGRLAVLSVPLPDEKAREEIFKIHFRDLALADEVDFGRLARLTPDFSGADIAEVANEARMLVFEQIVDGNTDGRISTSSVVKIIKRMRPGSGVAGYA